MLAIAADLSRRGEPHVLLTVVRAVRPTSGKPGDKAVLTAGGQWFGWVGGSCAEPSARRLALAALHSGKSTLLRLTNSKQELASEGVEVLPMTCFSGGALDIFIEPQCQHTRLYLLGKSPVTDALARLGEAMRYQVLQEPELPASLGSTAGDAAVPDWPEAPPRGSLVVVSSHGRKERPALQWALKGSPQYVGLVASRKRRDAVCDALRQSGVPDCALERLDSPAGLDIGGRGPEEVALSILAGALSRRQATQHCEDAAPVRSKLSAVLVAAGLSRRMGNQNKLLLDVQGVPMVRRAALMLCECPFEQVVVVVGHQQAAVRKALAGLAITVITNEDYNSGQHSSVRAGLSAARRIGGTDALDGSTSGAMICLADQPWLTAEDLLALWRIFDNRNRGNILIPRFEGQRGNPVVMGPAAVEAAAVAEVSAAGGRRFVDENDPDVEFWDGASRQFVQDVDSPQDISSMIPQEPGE